MITDYASLQAAVIEYLARDQDVTVTARVPTLIQLCEAKLNRAVFCRQMEQRSTATLDTTITDPEFVLLPSDFQSMRRVRLSSVSGKPQLEFKSQVQLDEYRSYTSNTAGKPLYFTVSGTEMELAPTPDADYTIEMVYRQNIPPLALNSSNWLLTLAPDIYLYGTLLEAAPYIKQDSRIQVWGAAFSTCIDQLNGLSTLSGFNSGPLTMRTNGVTP